MFYRSKLVKNAIKDIVLSPCNTPYAENENVSDIYIVSPDFYRTYVKGKEAVVTKIMKCKAIAVHYSSKANDKVNFTHNAKANSSPKTIERILNMGLKCSEFTLPLGKGIYVWKDEQKKSIASRHSFLIRSYEGDYLKLVYFEDRNYDNEFTEYLLLKAIEKNIVKIK